jgi:tRNA(Arg) A34 adenosine deaminase TadA
MSRMTDEHWMRLAIETGREGIAAGQSPFGAVIVHGDQLLAASHNVVWQMTDITAHAEIHAIRLACRKVGDVNLSGCRIYSTTEPCPMCFAACHWARLEAIYFGAAIADAMNAGFSELTISNEQMKALGGSGIRVFGGVLAREATELFEQWKRRPERRTY